jgi:hypothetical protein
MNDFEVYQLSDIFELLDNKERVADLENVACDGRSLYLRLTGSGANHQYGTAISYLLSCTHQKEKWQGRLIHYR